MSAPFGPHTDAEWEFLVDSVLVRRDDGRWTLHYDPAIGVPCAEMRSNTSLSRTTLRLWLKNTQRCSVRDTAFACAGVWFLNRLQLTLGL